MKTANRIVMTLAGCLFIFAAVLKAHQLLTEPILAETFWESWLFSLIQIPLELGLGIWLICGLFRKAVWLIATLAFAGFIVYTLHRGLIGAASCGCFGRVHVNPWITLSAIDIPFFLALLFLPPKGEKLLPPPWPSAKHFFGVAIPTFVLLGVLVPVLVFNKPPEKTDKYILVKPEEWIPSQQWPMLKHIDIADSLRSAVVVALLYHSDCPDCREAIPVYDQLNRDLATNDDAIRFAFIEIPPYARPKDSPIPADTSCLTGKLDSSKKWYIKTPLVVLLQDGSLVKYWQVEVPDLDRILDALSGDDL